MNRRDTMIAIGLSAVAAKAVAIPQGLAASPADVAASVEDLRRAMLHANPTELNRILSPFLSWGHSNGLIQTRDEFVDVVGSGGEVFHTLEFREPSIWVSNDVGIARHTFVSDLSVGDDRFSVELGEMQVWRREEGSLRCFARQAFAT